MTRFRKLPASLLLGLSLAAPFAPAVRAEAPAQKVAARPAADIADAAFAFDLHNRLATGSQNLVWSPLSVDAALSMLLEGARAGTADGILRAMHLSGTPDAARRAAIVQALTSAELSGAFGVWIQKGYPIEKPFLEAMTQGYHARLDSPDFKHAFEAARGDINDWIKKQTRGKIPELIPKGALDEYTRLVLANAIYFKGKWASEFDKKQTQDAPFFTPSGEAKAKLMFQHGRFALREDADAQIISLPYQGDALEMIVILPKTKDGLPALEKKLSPALLDGWLRGLAAGSENADVFLPRFKIKTSVVLPKQLADMGMADAFDDKKSDLSGIASPAKTGTNLYVSNVLHQATIEVDEEGTEASAATGIIVAEPSSVSIPATFRADHPFLYLIRDKRNGAIAFMGRVMDPSK